MYAGHKAYVEFLMTFLCWEYSGPLYNWLDSQIWVTPSENLGVQ